jgi:hypothetical protein
MPGSMRCLIADGLCDHHHEEAEHLYEFSNYNIDGNTILNADYLKSDDLGAYQDEGSENDHDMDIDTILDLDVHHDGSSEDDHESDDVDPDADEENPWPISDYCDPDDVTVFVDDLAYGLVTVQAPSWYINADLKAILSDRNSFDSVAVASPLSYASGLLDVITSPISPSPKWFETLLMIKFKKV